MKRYTNRPMSMASWFDCPKRHVVVEQLLPVSREATIKLRHPNWQHILPGSVLEANLKFFDNRMHEVHYKHSWWKRVWYTSLIGRRYWNRSE